jgi:WD40 repeat protein/tetratricopeptide (TPR) repeat protein
LETLIQVMGREPVPPRRMDAHLSRDLETICLKCLEKEPGRRYDSAAALADDLDNFSAGRPINARPVGAFERTWRWCCRNPVPTFAAATVLLVTVIAFALITASRNQAVALADTNGRLAADKTKLADDNILLATEKEWEATNAREQEKKARREATLLAYQQASTLCESGKIDQGMLAFAHGLSLAEKAEAPDLERLFRLNLASWQRHLHTLRAVLPHGAGISAVACSPDGRTIATACWDHTTRLWDVASGEPLGQPIKHDTKGTGLVPQPDGVVGLAFSPDGKSLLTVGYMAAIVWDVATGKQLAVLDQKYNRGICAAFGSDGRTVLTGAMDGRARLWDVTGQKEVGEPLAFNDWITAVAFRPDGGAFVTAGKRGGVQVWDASTRRPLASFLHPGGVVAIAFSPDGKMLLTGGNDGTARLWDAQRGRPLASPMSHPQAVTSVAFSPDGSLVLSGCLDGAARLWDPETGELVGQPMTHPGEVLAVAFGADGRTLLTGQGRAEGDARLWDVAPGVLLGGPMGHSNSVLAVAVSPDGRRVGTAGRDNTARLWDAETAEPVGDALRHQAEINALAFSPDSQTLVTGADDSSGRFWHAADGKPVLHEALVGQNKFSTQWSVGGPGGFNGGSHDPWDKALMKDRQPVWGPERGKLRGRNFLTDGAVYTLAFNPAGTKLAAGGRAGATLYDLKDRGPDRPLSMPLIVKEANPDPFAKPSAVPQVYAVAFSPDGRLAATAAEDGSVRVWDAAKFDPDTFLAGAKGAKDAKEYFRLEVEFRAARVVAGPFRHDAAVVALAFSPDSRTLLTGGADKTARLWDLSTGKARVLRHQGPVVALAFRSDGKECVTGSWDGTARLWDAETGEQIGLPLTHQGKVLAVDFSRDGGLVLTGGEDHTARLWDAATGQPVGQRLRQRDQIRAVAFRPDGGAVVTAGDDHTARLWATPALAKGGADGVRLWVEAWTGQTREPDGTVRFLEPSRWQEKRKELTGSQPPVPPGDALARCRRQAREAETAGRWHDARWNLDRLVAADHDNARYRLRRGVAAEKLHEATAAWADYDAAAKLAPEWWEPRFHRGELAVLSRKWQQGIDDLSDALARFPHDRPQLDDAGPDSRLVSILFMRGYARAAMGKWKEADADFQIAHNRFADTSLDLWLFYAHVLLKLQEAKHYGVVCQGMLDKFANPQDEYKSTVITLEYGRQEIHTFGRPFDPREAAAMAWVCSLSPNGPATGKRPLELARKAAEKLPNDYACARSLGAALYRAGEVEKAVQQLEAAAALQKSAPATWLFLAMAHQKCTHGDKAKEWLDKARAWVEQARKPRPEEGAEKNELSWDNLPWTEQVALELLQAEAAKLIEGEPPSK